MLPQLVEQIQFAFHQFPKEQVLYAFSVVGVLFRAYKFNRERTPAFDSFADLEVRRIPEATFHVHSLFDQEGKDYRVDFKRWWTEARTTQLQYVQTSR